jgi:hypothetical protein
MDSSIALTIIALIVIVGLVLCHSLYKKIVVKPEFESKALQLLNEDMQIRQDTEMPEKEKAVRLLMLRRQCDELVISSLKDSSQASAVRARV